MLALGEGDRNQLPIEEWRRTSDDLHLSMTLNGIEQ